VRRRVLVRKIRTRWVWTCTLCHPAARGQTRSWEGTIRNVHRHLRNRKEHHRYVINHHGKIIT
jgi:hypothetical protein